MTRWLSIALFGLTFGSIAWAEEPAPLPKGLPPVFGTAIASAKDKALTITLTCPESRWQVIGKVVPKKEWPKLQVDVKKNSRTLFFGGPSALAESRVVDIHGKNLSENEILKRLKTETPVLVSVDWDMLDPYYLKLVREDAVVILLGPRDGMPAPELLPAANSK